MKKQALYAFAWMLVLACGSNQEETTPVPEKTDSAEVKQPPPVAEAFGNLIANLPVLGLPLDTEELEGKTSKGVALDTHDVRRFNIIDAGYKFDMPESWTAIGIISTETNTLLVYEYTSTAQSNIALVVYNGHGGPKKTAALNLVVNMPPNGEMLPYKATINEDLMINVSSKNISATAQTGYDLQSDGTFEETFHKVYENDDPVEVEAE